MPRPRNEQPTPAELEVLKTLWEHGPCTVRQVMDILNKNRPRRAYTSVMSLLTVMTEKKLLARKARARAFVYSPRYGRRKTLSLLLGDILNRAFEGSTSSLVAHLLEGSGPSAKELDEIRRTIDAYEKDEE